MPTIQERFCLIKLIDSSELDLAFLRSLLANNYVYIEIDKTFVISCLKSFKDQVSAQLRNKAIKFFLVYVNLKPGCDVKTSGLNGSDDNLLRKIIKDE